MSTFHYRIYLSIADKAIGDLYLSEGKMTVQYSGELTLSEYIKIHEIINYLQKKVNGEIDDSNSFLGYLPDGESVYITKNWDKWVNYIYSSMKNCKNDASIY